MRQLRDARGQGLVEFSLVAVLATMLIFGVVEMCRLVLVYTTIGNAARIGVRYAMVHGANSSISPQVQNVVNTYLRAGTVNTASATVGVTYPDPIGSLTSGCTAAGCRVTVTVSYPYDVFVNYFPIHVTLGTTSQGVITY